MNTVMRCDDDIGDGNLIENLDCRTTHLPFLCLKHLSNVFGCRHLKLFRLFNAATECAGQNVQVAAACNGFPNDNAPRDLPQEDSLSVIQVSVRVADPPLSSSCHRDRGSEDC